MNLLQVDHVALPKTSTALSALVSIQSGLAEICFYCSDQNVLCEMGKAVNLATSQPICPRNETAGKPITATLAATLNFASRNNNVFDDRTVRLIADGCRFASEGLVHYGQRSPISPSANRCDVLLHHPAAAAQTGFVVLEEVLMGVGLKTEH